MWKNLKESLIAFVQAVLVFMIGSFVSLLLYHRGTATEFPYSAWLVELKYAVCYLAGVIWLATTRIVKAIRQTMQ